VVYGLEAAMHQPVNLPFERIVHEFARWRAVPKPERSEAPSWWWGPALEAFGQPQPMPAEWCSSLGLPDGSTISAGADVLLAPFAGQTLLPWLGDFPRRTKP
jgi:hypothetical protein